MSLPRRARALRDHVGNDPALYGFLTGRGWRDACWELHGALDPDDDRRDTGIWKEAGRGLEVALVDAGPASKGSYRSRRRRAS